MVRPTSTSSGQDRFPHGQCPKALLWVRAQWHLKVGPQAWGHSHVGSHMAPQRHEGCWGQTLRPPLLRTNGQRACGKPPLEGHWRQSPAACLPPAHTGFTGSPKHHILNTPWLPNVGVNQASHWYQSGFPWSQKAPRFHSSAFGKKASRLPLRELKCSPTV